MIVRDVETKYGGGPGFEIHILKIDGHYNPTDKFQLQNNTKM